VARFLAIDWDQNQLHVVSAVVGGGTVKIQRAAVWQEEKSPNPADAEELGKLLRERLKAAGISAAPVLACVGRDRVILKDVRFPAVPDAEEPAVVRFQAVKELTDPPDEVVIDYTNAGESGTERRALALIVRKELLEAYQKLCHAAGLKLAGMTPRPFGLAACLRKVVGTTVLTPAPEPPDGAAAIVTVSDRWAEFCVVRNGNLLLARALAVGPGLAGEVRRNLAVYNGQNPGSPVCAIYLAGSGGELRERLGGMTETPVHAFDPFAGAERAELPAAHRGSFAGAVGLLHARSEAKGLPINFVQPRQPKAQRDPNRERVLIAALVFVFLFAVGAVWGHSVYSDYENDHRTLETDRATLEAKLVQVRDDGKRLKALDEWDTLVWLDEIYDIAQRIPDVNALRITSVKVEALSRNTKVPQRYAAKITIEGRVLDRRGGRAPLDAFIDEFKKDGYYSPSPPTGTLPKFTLIVNVERRAPGDYKRKLPEAPKKVEEADLEN
jgi:Tfp pilus assembly PilM family ATPase